MALRGKVPTTAAAPLLLLATVFLVSSLAYNLEHLDTGDEQLPPLPSLRGGGGGEVDATPGGGGLARTVFLGILWSVLGLGIAAAVYTKLMGGKLSKLVSVWELLGYVLLILLFLLLATFWQSASGAVEGLLVPFGSRGSSGGTGNPVRPETGTMSSGFVLLSIGVLLSLLVVAAVPVANFLRGMLTSKPPPKESPRARAARTVAVAIRDLRGGGDYRAAILRCYSELCALLAARGLSSQASLTAREIEQLALRRLGLSQSGIDTLTRLFEEARYSRHEIGPEARDAAVGALTSLKGELEARPSASP